MENIAKDYQDLVNKVDNLKKQDKMDLSVDQDLSIAIMNLISIEEHFFFTAEKTGKAEYLDMLMEVREMRKVLLKKLIKQYEGEVWCISKHLLAASIRLMEVGTKEQGRGNKEDAKDLFHKSFQLYSLFWALNMKMINVEGIKKIDDGQINKEDKKRGGFLGKFGDLVKRAIDCCWE